MQRDVAARPVLLFGGMMTHAVLTARLVDAGLDPALFDENDLNLIAQSLAQLPPALIRPALALPELPCRPDALLDAIRSAAQDCLDAMDMVNTMLFVFARGTVRGKLCGVCDAAGRALPGWLQEGGEWMAECEAVCTKIDALRKKGQAAQRELACRYAAALILRSPAVDDYFAALRELDTDLAALDASLDQVSRAMQNFGMIMDDLLPAMLEAALLLAEADDCALSPAVLRQAALRLREAADGM